MKQVKITNLEFWYTKKDPLFEELNLTIESGKVYGLLGKNGSGKTTLLKLISGLMSPKKGECSVFEESAKDRLPSVLQEIFVVPEEFYVPPIKIKRYVQINSSYYPRFDIEFFDKYLEDIGLNRDKRIDRLSYGQKKKVLIGFALATNCKLLILDEPTNGLDIPSKSYFRKIIASTLTDDRSIIISTHQVRDLSNMLDSIIVLEKGSVLLNKSIDEITNGLVFDRRSNDSDVDVLYSEKILGEYSCISKNENGNFTEVDIELMFNAIVKGSVSSELFQNIKQ